jgi:UDP-N-acetylmuramoyl-tripeptide--D-alanyl-D-alanine ligase
MELYSLFIKHPVICTDSRSCPLDSLFFALKGENFNANAFALGALEKGCAYAVVDEEEFAIDNRFILVDNVLETLQELATYHRQQMQIPIIGITGTNGKTTTKELIAAVLQEKYKVHYTRGNFNNHIGVALTLLQFTREHEIAVVEMGANHPAEIKFLSEMAMPDFGIVTNVGKAHLEGFGTFENVKKTKAELYDYIFEKGKAIFIHQDNENLMEMSAKAGFKLDSPRLLKYSTEDSKAAIFGRISSCSPFLNMECKLGDANSFTIETQLIGAYNAENVLAAVAIGKYFDLSAQQIKAGLEKYTPRNNRSQLTLTDRNHLIVDAYNANPTSMKAAILNFIQMDVANKVLILGDMLELGKQTKLEHANIVKLLETASFEKVILVGKYFSETTHDFLSFEKVETTIDYLKGNPVDEAYVLIKGSRGIKLEKVISVL